MRVSFQHANPDAGNESFLLRFDGDAAETVCVLVDAGAGVNLDALLEPGDSLAAVCLTHAHLDHYEGLADAHRDGAPILTAPATASVLTDVLDVARDEYGVVTTDAMADAVTPIDDWTTVAPGVDVHPVSAGHVPGGAGFLVRATDGEETHHVLATGDFTRRRAGGYPGFDPAAVPDVDVLFLTASTNDGFESSLSDALGTTLERVHAGARTLVATSGLFGVHVAYLLSALVDEYDLDVPVRVVGQVAKHYEALGYDHPAVEPIPVFEDPRDCLDPGVVTVAGPEIPRERSSGRLFDALRDDPSACVVQLVGSGETPLTGGRCTVHQYECVNHPTRETLAAVHDAVDPTETVVVHRHGGAKAAFNDLDSVVWGAGDTDEYTLYDGWDWQLPPWMSGRTVARGAGQSLRQFTSSAVLDSMALPAVERHANPDLAAEGVDTDAIDRHLHRNADARASPDVPDSLARQSPTTDADTTTEPERMTANTDPTHEDTAESSPGTPPALVDTTHAGLEDAVDPRMQELLDETGLTAAEFMDELRDRRRQTDAQQSPGNDPGDDAPDEQSNTGEHAHSDDSTDFRDESGSTPENAEADTQSDNEADTESNREADTQPDAEADNAQSTEAAATPAASDEDASFELAVNPITVALAGRAVDAGAVPDGDPATVGEFVADAVTDYVFALLGGDAAGDERERVHVDLGASAGVEALLNDAVAETERFDSVDALAAEGIAAALTGDVRRTVTVPDTGNVTDALDAVVRNDAFVFEDRTAVVETAVVRYLTDV